MLVRRVGALGWALLLGGVLGAPPARAAVEIDGLWRVGVFFTGSPLVRGDVCSLTIVRNGTALAIAGSCQGAANQVQASGSIDPATGSFVANGSAAPCAAFSLSGTVAFDSASFTGSFRCPALGVAGGVTASRCGNGRIDAGEQCDDGNIFDGDCCDATCIAAAPGTVCTDDGDVCTADACDAAQVCQHTSREGRRCDDGNTCTVGDRCVDGQCGMPQPDDAPCSDANACTTGDRCIGGTCIGDPVVCPSCLACEVTQGCVPTISTGCQEATASSLVMRRLRSDAVTWTWQSGDAIRDADFGDPTAATDYDFCVYDGGGAATGPPRLLFGNRATAGSDWTAMPRGYRYWRRDRSPAAVRRIRLSRGPAGKSRVAVWKQGRDLALPPLQSIVEPVTVQLKSGHATGAACWSAVFGQPAVRSPLSYRADARRAPASAPNIVIISLDDVRADGVDRMPTLARLAQEGVSFSNSFAVNPLCAPSRATLLTGLNSPRHGVRALAGVIGGAERFRALGSDRQTIATWLQAAGYMTGLFGKYINVYGFDSEARQGPGGGHYVPPGWSRWRAMISPEHFGGMRGVPYTLVDERGVATLYDDTRTDRQYSTDVLAAQLRLFVADAASRQRPFLAVWTPYAGHVEVPSLRPEPAARHFRFFRTLEPWRPASYAEADMRDKPGFMRAFTVGTPIERSLTDQMRIGAYESLLSVDEQIQILLGDLARLGIDRNTVIVVTSDNGVGWGEHRIFFQGKECAYEECLRVPMIVRDPRSAARGVTHDAAVLNIDIAPTVAEWAGVQPGTATDGVSFAAWVAGSPPPVWRDDFLIEHWRAQRDAGVTYVGQVRDGDQVRISYGDTRHHPRPTVLFEFDAGDGVSGGAVAVPLGADADASFAALGAAIGGRVPSATPSHVAANNRLTLLDASPDHSGVYLDVVRDQGGVMTGSLLFPDWFGVRDVTHRLTYVEHESGDTELYDLAVDPQQLASKAADAAYAETRQRLARRLADLLR